MMSRLSSLIKYGFEDRILYCYNETVINAEFIQYNTIKRNVHNRHSSRLFEFYFVISESKNT